MVVRPLHTRARRISRLSRKRSAKALSGATQRVSRDRPILLTSNVRSLPEIRLRTGPRCPAPQGTCRAAETCTHSRSIPPRTPRPNRSRTQTWAHDELWHMRQVSSARTSIDETGTRVVAQNCTLFSRSARACRRGATGSRTQVASSARPATSTRASPAGPCCARFSSSCMQCAASLRSRPPALPLAPLVLAARRHSFYFLV